jgi:GT2 family glycosyltransferase
MSELKHQEQTVDLPAEFVSGKIGVVTVTYGSGQVLPDFLASLDKQAYRNFILIAIDNNSQDNTLDQLHAYSGCKLTLIANEQNLGVAAANNQGIRAAIAAGCEHVLLLNNDVVFNDHLFQQLLDGLTEFDCQMTTPMIYYYDQPNVIWYAGANYIRWLGYLCLHRSQGTRDTGRFSKATQVGYTSTCCVLIRREVFGLIGLMDERYFVYFDDTDFMLRCLKARIKLFFLPSSKMQHKVSSLTGHQKGLPNRFVYRNLAFYTFKHVGRFRAVLYSWMYQTIFLINVMCGRDTRETYLLKRSAFNEGLRMASEDATISQVLISERDGMVRKIRKDHL